MVTPLRFAAIAVTAAGAVLLAGCGPEISSAAPQPAPAVTRTVVHVHTHWRTRTVSTPATVDCYAAGGLPYPPGYLRGQAGSGAWCTASLSEVNGTPALTLTLPGGASGTYQVGPVP